jgi:sialate O-acetylesterase
MINSWRKKWKEGSFPFYFVQIAPFDYGNKVNSAYLRESQLKTMQKVPNTGMAVTLDIGAKHPIHPPYKEEVGNRLAYWALAKTYGLKKVDYSGPVYKSMKVKGNKAYLSFDHAPNGLTIKGDSLTHFTIAGSDKKFYAAKAHITNHNELVVRSDEVSHPVAVRYGWKNWLVGHLFDAQGLPAPSFRTDDW